MQIALKEDPSLGRYATDIATLGWVTSNGTSTGRFFDFGTSGVEDCDPGTYAVPDPIGIAEATAIQLNEVLSNWRSACMDMDMDILLNSP